MGVLPPSSDGSEIVRDWVRLDAGSWLKFFSGVIGLKRGAWIFWAGELGAGISGIV